MDQTVFVAYRWPSSLTDSEVLERLLALNHERAASQTSQSAGAKAEEVVTADEE